MRYHMVLLPMVGILSLTACGGSSGASTTEPTEAQIRAEGAVPEALSLTSTSLVSEYIRDAAGSDVKFKGKTLELTGAVIDFGTNKENVAYVNLAGAGRGAGVGPMSFHRARAQGVVLGAGERPGIDPNRHLRGVQRTS